MSEREEALALANRLLDEPNADPDDDLRMLSRQLIRRTENVEKLKNDLVAQHDPELDLIHANRDEILRKHEEAVRLIREVVRNNRYALCGYDRIDAILDALNTFHPMHTESWKGWPQ